MCIASPTRYMYHSVSVDEFIFVFRIVYNTNFHSTINNRYKLKKAAMRLRAKIRRLVSQVHRKLAKILVTQYRVVLLPEFQTSQMVRRGKRKIRKKTVRNMLTWRHYQFRQYLIAKAELHGCTVVVCDEPYTSKTCSCCGNIHSKLGGSKVFKCPKCSVTMDRDVNGAKNILLRYLTINGL